MMEFEQSENLKFPIWTYLSQPLFDGQHKLILNPLRFWYLYRVEFLEHCLRLECQSQNIN
jgi:hypothetical protein